MRLLQVDLRAVQADAGRPEQLTENAHELRQPGDLPEQRVVLVRRLDAPHARPFRPVPRLEVVDLVMGAHPRGLGDEVGDDAPRLREQRRVEHVLDDQPSAFPIVLDLLAREHPRSPDATAAGQHTACPEY